MLNDLAARPIPNTVEARKLEYDCPPYCEPGEEGKPASIVPKPYSNFLEFIVVQYIVLAGCIVVAKAIV